MTDRVDNFNRVGGALGTPSDAGSAWVLQSGLWIVGTGGSANIAQQSDATGQATAVLESSVSDVDVQVTFPTAPSTGDVGIVFRGTDDNNYMVAVLNGSAGTGVRCLSRVGGSFSQIGSTGSAKVASGDVWKVTANGSSITVYQNTVSVFTASNSTHLTATKHGIRSNGDASTTFDDFSITGLVGGGGGGVFGSNFYRHVSRLGA